MMRAGALPYAGFYTHYGPLGYGVQSLFSGLIASPAVALRACQAAFFCLVAAVALALAGRLDAASRAWPATLVLLLLLSSLTALASFCGLMFVLIAIAAAAMPELPGRRGVLAWAAVAGAAVAGAFLTRPAFGLYAASAVAAVTLAAEDRPRRRGMATAMAAIGAVILVWLLFYRNISPAAAAQATLVFPARLSSAGLRYKPGPFVQAPAPLAVVFGLLIGSFPLAWMLGLRDPRANRIAAAAFALAGVCPLILRSSPRPARAAAWIAVLVLALAVLAVVVARRVLRRDALLRAAALFGVGAAAFGHYFWTRQDRPHFAPMIALGVVAATLSAFAMSARARWTVAIVFAAGALVLLPMAGLFPIERLWTGGVREIGRRTGEAASFSQSIWPCDDIPPDMAAAVRAADARSDPGSRFVAVASHQSRTEQDPILLFLISRRLPYTRWYAYDPGVQASPEVQGEMALELHRARSEAAVVWPAGDYQESSPAGAPAPGLTPFDREFRALYAAPVAHYGRFALCMTGARQSAEPRPGAP